MKRNAVLRIIVWSMVIVVLVGILIGGMFGRIATRSISEAERKPTENTYPIYTETFGDSIIGTLTQRENIYRSPDTNSEVLTWLDEGSTVQITKKETINGENWGYIRNPSGWLPLSTVEVRDSYVQETTVIESVPGEKDTFDASNVSELEIEWVAGEILIQPGDTDEIKVREDNVDDVKYAMVMKQTGNELKISFCDEGIASYFGVNTRSDLKKDLIITVPKDWVCESLSIECASAAVEVNDLTIREVDFDGALGACEFENCTVKEMDIDTASGDVRFIGSLDILDCDAASASVYAVLSNIPSRLDIDSMSGDLDITLPEDAGFTVTMDGMSSDFSSEFETTVKNGNQVCGNGSCRINIDAMSGDVTIRKGEPSAAPETP